MKASFSAALFLSGPSDVQRYTDLARVIVSHWNSVSAKKEVPTIILPVVWMQDVAGGVGEEPQHYINIELDKCDLLFAIFWARLGTPTTKHASGSVEEIKRFTQQKGGERVALFFCDLPPEEPYDRGQVEQLNAFRAEISKESFYLPFKEESQFMLSFRQQLDFKMHSLLEAADQNQVSLPAEPVKKAIGGINEEPAPSEADLLKLLSEIGSRSEPILLRHGLPKAMIEVWEFFKLEWTKEKPNHFKMAQQLANDVAISLEGILKNYPDIRQSTTVGGFIPRLEEIIQELKRLANTLPIPASFTPRNQYPYDFNNEEGRRLFWRRGEDLQEQLRRLAQLIDLNLGPISYSYGVSALGTRNIRGR